MVRKESSQTKNVNRVVVLTLGQLKHNKMQIKTRTHSMARHRKSPRSQRNLTVIDPLTLPKAPGGGGGPKKLCRCMCHSCE